MKRGEVLPEPPPPPVTILTRDGNLFVKDAQLEQQGLMRDRTSLSRLPPDAEITTLAPFPAFSFSTDMQFSSIPPASSGSEKRESMADTMRSSGGDGRS